MLEFRKQEPYSLRTRPDIVESEYDFRQNLDISDVNGVLFNVLASRNSSTLAEYDAVWWRENRVCFLEYKDSTAAYRRMNAKRAQQVQDTSRNLARTYGFLEFNYSLVVKGLEAKTTKGSVAVIPLEDLSSYSPDFTSAHVELDFIDKLADKYSREQNPVELERDTIIADISKLKEMFEQQL